MLDYFLFLNEDTKGWKKWFPLLLWDSLLLTFTLLDMR